LRVTDVTANLILAELCC